MSFDLNRDGVYSFVFIGTVANGKDGASVYSTEGVTLETLIQQIKVNDSVLFAEDNATDLIDPNAVIGDVFIYILVHFLLSTNKNENELEQLITKFIEIIP